MRVHSRISLAFAVVLAVCVAGSAQMMTGGTGTTTTTNTTTTVLRPSRSGAMHFGGLHLRAGGAFQATADATTPTLFHVQGMAVGTSPITGNTTLQFSHKVDTATTPFTVIEGTFRITAGNGDTITGTYKGVASGVQPGRYTHFAAEYNVTGGTGVYASFTGRGLIAATLRTTGENGGLLNIDFMPLPMLRLGR